MSSSPSESEAFLQEPLALSAPALDQQRFTIHVKRSIKKLADEDEDAPSRKWEKKSSLLAKLRASINSKKASAIDAVKRMGKFSELVVTCAICLVLLGGMALCSLWWFEERRAIASRWAKLMETSGFVDWPPLEDSSYVPGICAATPIVVGLKSLMVVPWSLLTRRASGTKLFLYGLIVVMATSLVLFRLTSALQLQPSIDENTVESLTSQSGGVANFNRGFCQAWCRKSEAGLAAFVRGDCGSKHKTEFDEILAIFEAKDWCLQAIAHQKYELVAEYSGVSPFAGLKGYGGRALTNMRPDTSTSLFVWILLMWPTGVLAILTSDPFNETK